MLLLTFRIAHARNVVGKTELLVLLHHTCFMMALGEDTLCIGHSDHMHT